MSEILLAEDNPADVYLIQEAFREHDIECTIRTAVDGRDDPDLIILDLNLPCHDGLEILQKLKSNEHTSQVPVVVLTSSDSPRDRAMATQLGATRYVRKPSNLEQFLELGAIFKQLLNQPSTKSDGACC
jgi:CheY-like chemotaxis protein